MTAPELVAKLNNEFNLGEWPKTYEVDADTYANACQYIFNWYMSSDADKVLIGDMTIMKIATGPNHGIVFKNVELILKRGEEK